MTRFVSKALTQHSEVMRKNIGYKDIRDKRKLIDTVIKELGG